MKTEYNRVVELAEIFENFWVPFELTVINHKGVTIEKLVDQKSGDVYLERYDTILDTYSVYKFDKFNVPTEWNPEEDSEDKVKLD